MDERIVALLAQMDAKQASDLFLTVGRPPYMRVFGALQPVDEAALTAADFQAFWAARLPPDMPERLERERDLDVGVTLGVGRRYRVNLFYQQSNLSLVARRVPSGALDFAALRIPAVVQKFAEAPRGLVLITGATGSGKSSTMAAMLHHINRQFPRHIVTVEDPIEFIHTDLVGMVTQREVGNDTATFASALRHVVRQSPDVIFIGEMRDLETIQTAISAAMTGHLVVTTMHTVDTAQTLERIINYFPSHLRDQVALDLSLALVGIVSQRLLPRAKGGGQVPAFEILAATPLARRLIATRQLDDISDVLKAGAGDGMQTFTRALAALCQAGEITVEVAAAAATNRDEFMLAIQGMETGIETLRQKSVEGEGEVTSMKSLLRAAVKHHASDLILTAGSPPLLRISGELNELAAPPFSGVDVQRLLFSVLSPSQRALFEQQREIDFALSVSDIRAEAVVELQHSRFRVNGFYQKGSVAAVLRVISQTIPSARELGIPPVVTDLANKRQGMVLVTGPTGHGKSTTLACLIDEINRSRGCHIITIEDPIEFVHKNLKAVVEQREVYADTKSFAQALKFVLRQAPDVILIGEMRDPETIAAALTAAETGHLVLATLHTNDASQSIDRIIDSFPAHQQNQVRSQLSICLTAVVSQRLLPRADGAGRIAAYEIMLGSAAVQALIREGRTHQMASTIETSAKDGMITMDRALKNLYAKNLITRATLKAVARNPDVV